MRSTKYADNRSVEIYTQKYEGFKLALDRVDIKKVNPASCDEYRSKLEETYDKVLLDNDFQIFRPFRDILDLLCKLVVLAQDEVVLEKSIAEKEE